MSIYRKYHIFLLLALGLLATACGNTENEYSSYRCYVLIDNNVHQDPTLASAMNPMAPVVFCHISETLVGGVRHFAFRSSQGLQSTAVENGIDLRRTFAFGMENGVIIGFGNLDNPAIFYAYDAQCPNCYDPETIPVRSKPLTMLETGLASCGSCKRQYNMNTGGNIVSGDSGSKLTRYRGATDGPFSVLRVN